MTDATVRGALQWLAEAQRLVVVEDGTSKRRNVTQPGRDLHPDLRDRPPGDLHGTPVDFVVSNGQPREIRPVGAAPAPRSAPVVRLSETTSNPDAFHNPYTFIPAPPRDRYPAETLGDDNPIGHHRITADRWTGTIRVHLTVVTPLLLLDTNIEATGGHETYSVLRRNGSPHLAATAVKGMLRSAYEAVTNSRFGVFVGHDERLGTRMAADAAQRMVPARISDDGREVILMPGDTQPEGQTKPNPLLHAAWLPTYGSVTRPRGFAPKHGDEVDAEVELFQHHRWDRGARRHVADFTMWRVRSIAPAGQQLPVAPPARPTTRVDTKSWYEPLDGKAKRIRGHVMSTGRNFSRKHDERIFFADQWPEERKELTKGLAEGWEKVVANYRDAHRHSDIHNRKDDNKQEVGPSRWLGPAPGKTAWSPHQYDDTWLKLGAGQLCYARVENGAIAGLYPVMIARKLYDAAPVALLPKSLRPATTVKDLSPADRVFGWVTGKGAGAYRGQLRIGPVTCLGGADAIDDDPVAFGSDGVPLAILGQPKPQQARFYTAASAAEPHRPLPVRLHRDKWYAKEHGIRGRKVYPHHAGLPQEYWKKPVDDRTQSLDAGRYQEYRRPHKGDETGTLTGDRSAFVTGADEQRDDQNRSIRGWVKPTTVFAFDIDISNLSDIELGALLWLLHLPDGHHHRLGFGKPLGFGSVRLDLQSVPTTLRKGDEWATYYRSLAPIDDAPSTDTAVLDQLQRDFEDAMPDKGTILVGFLAAAAGDPTAPVHYPRARPKTMPPGQPVPPDPRGRAYAWFVANERMARGTAVYGRSLPTVGGESLEVYEDTSK